MSAIISMRAEDGIIVFTDGAVYDREYNVIDFVRKIAISDRVPIAVATRGPECWTEPLANAIVGWADEFGVDEALATLAEAMPVWREKGVFRAGSDGAEVVVASCSPTGRHQHLVFRTTAARVGDQVQNPFELFDPGKSYLGCTPAPIEAPFPVIRRQRPDEGVLAYATEIGVQLMQHYREQRTGAKLAHVVGGHVDMTLVDAEGVLTRKVHRWGEDRVGQKIDPFARNLTPIGAGRNRQQRRAAERAARLRAIACACQGGEFVSATRMHCRGLTTSHRRPP